VAKVASRFAIRRASMSEVHAWCAEPARTTYLLDVRTPDEFAAGHVVGAHSAPGGQLVQATDTFVGTRNARLVLIDSDGVRATMTASWLVQLGWPEVVVWEKALEEAPLETGSEHRLTLGLDVANPSRVTPSVLGQLLATRAVSLVDLASSIEYRRGHIGGAQFAVRSRFAATLPRLAKKDYVVLTSPDGVLAQLAAREAADVLGREVLVLDGGTAHWRSLGKLIDTKTEHLLDKPDDVYYLPYDNRAEVAQAMRDYINWEVALVEQLKRDGIRFETYPATA
ncbi:MAG: rhodanese-like domain-containing protein, partial [Burkholderiales bacterium]